MMLADIVKEEIGKQCIENNNIRCKQSVKRIGVEQMCDVAIIFNLLKQIERQKNSKTYHLVIYLLLLMLFFLS